jgi:nicotinamide riboside kinase
VPEYGRDYTVERLAAAAALAATAGRAQPGMDDLLWTPEDFVEIARRQVAMEDEAAAIGSPVLVCDTDAFATGVWHERYLGTRHPGVEATGDSRHHDLYLLTDHDGVPFEQDGIRDGEHVRAWMTGRFADRLDETGRRWVRLTGSLEQRLADALAAVDELVTSAWDFAPPLEQRSAECEAAR